MLNIVRQSDAFSRNIEGDGKEQNLLGIADHIGDEPYERRILGAGIFPVSRGDEIAQDPQACPDDRADDDRDQPVRSRNAEQQRLHGAEFFRKKFTHGRIISRAAAKLIPRA